MTMLEGRKFYTVMAVSDTHGDLFGIDPDEVGADFVVIAGDVTPCSIWSSSERYMKEEFSEWVRSHPQVDFVMTPGNHDFVLSPGHKSFMAVKQALPQNLHLLIDEEWTSTGGVRFWGTPWVPRISGRWAFESIDYTDNEFDLETQFSMIPKGLNVLVTHTPPRIEGAEVDVSLQFRTRSRPFGSTALEKAIRRACPEYCVCGHIHSGRHSPVRIAGDDGDTVVYNVSRVDEHYEIAYDPTVFMVDIPIDN